MSTTSATPEQDRAVAELVDVFLAGYWSARTRANYAFILSGWFDWCTVHAADVGGAVDPRAIKAWSPICRPAGMQRTRSPGGPPRCRRSTVGASASS